MKIEHSTAKQLFITVFYGAILGNYIAIPFGIAIDSIVSGTSKAYLVSDEYLIFLKSAIFLFTAIYFSFEYLYSIQNPEYKFYYLFADFSILVLGMLIMRKINLEKEDVPHYKHIALYFFIIMLIHTLWSFVFLHIWKKRKGKSNWSAENPEDKIKHYEWVLRVAAVLMILFLAILLLLVNKVFDEGCLSIPLILTILLSALAYFLVMRNRKFL